MQSIYDFASNTWNYLMMQTQHAKEKVGLTEQELDPKVEDAKLKLKQIDVIMYRYQSNIYEIIECIPQLNETSRKFSQLFVQNDFKYGGKARNLTNTLDLFFETAGEICDEALIQRYDKNLKSIFQEIRETIDKLKEIKSERHNIRLMKCALENKVESLKLEGSPELLATTRISYEEKKIELEIISEKFVKYVNNMWNIRNELIERPMQELVTLVYQIIKSLYMPCQALKSHLTKEDLTREYLPEIVLNETVDPSKT